VNPLKIILQTTLNLIPIIYVVSFIAQASVASSAKTYFFEKVGNEKQIPTESIVTMIEGEGGFLWLGTQHGLTRYDGYQFKNYYYDVNNPNSVSNNQVYRLAQDKYNRIYLGYYNNGFSVFNTKEHKFTHYNNKTTLSPSHNKIYKILPTDSGKVLIATRLAIDIFDPNKKQIDSIKPSTVAKFSPRTAIIDNTDPNIAWIATNKAIWHLDIKQRKFTHYIARKDKSSPLHLKQISSNEIWLTTYASGVKKVDLITKKITNLLGDVDLVLDIFAFSKDEYWLMAHKKGIIRVNAKGEELGLLTATPFNDHSITDKKVSSAIRMSSGTIFVSSWASGLNKHTPNNNLFSSYFLGPNNTTPFNVSNVTEFANNTLLIGTNSGLLLFSLTTGAFLDIYRYIPKASPIHSARISDFLTLKNDTIWIVSDKGVFEYNMIDKKLLHHPLPKTLEGSIMNVQISKDQQTLYLKGTSAFLAYDIASREIEELHTEDENHKQLLSGSRSRLTVDAYSNLFVHNGNDIFMLIAGEDKVKKIDTSGTGINDIFSMKNNDNGILVFSDKGIYTAENYKNKIPKLVLSSLSLDSQSYVDSENLQFDNQGRMWNATKLYDFINEKIIEFGTKDGIDLGANWDGSYTKLKNGDLVFGGSKGIQITHPNNFKYIKTSPKIVLTNHWFNGVAQQPIFQRHTDIDNFSSIRFEFSALEYADPELIKYQYKLDGYDVNWQDTTAENRIASYTNLPPGNYTFLVKSTNKMQSWGGATTLAHFRILPKYYQTWWFKLLSFVFLLTVLFKAIKYQLSRKFLIKQKEADRELAIERATMMSDLVDKKDRVLADVSHELRTPLTVLKLQIESLQHNLEDDLQSSYKEIDNKLSDIGSLINDIYQLAQSDIGALTLQYNVLSFPETINHWINEFQLFANDKQLTVSINNQLITSTIIEADVARLKQVLTNIISNSCSYTDAPGKIVITLSEKDDYLTITIDDSSPSVQQEQLSLIFERLYRAEKSRSRATGGSGLGLSICKSLVEAHNGIITAQASELGGLKVTIRLPVYQIMTSINTHNLI